MPNLPPLAKKMQRDKAMAYLKALFMNTPYVQTFKDILANIQPPSRTVPEEKGKLMDDVISDKERLERAMRGDFD